ncbi:phosphotransferase enzyme family protein [Microlunatus parietis]|uniref:Homoserine kinase type II n=1 Tax=Microlunatus parietis TaxID=682979 RepID=A0A7Y9LDK3_9ACTN|nr:phosphotransferase [Microlunatus parietis]NYE72031.1 homoserine kinase type II [Microlunatus parietis]
MIDLERELSALLARNWSIEAVLTAPARGTNNLMRIVHDAGEPTGRPLGLIRVYQNLDHDRVIREHRLLDRLAGAGLPFRVPRPRPAADGRTVIETEAGPVSLIDWIDGSRPDLDRPEALRAAGRALGRLDAALADVPAEAAPFDWTTPDLALAGIDDDRIDALVAAGLAAEQVAWLRDHSGPPPRRDGLPLQVIHEDFGASNLLAAGPPTVITGVIDFEVAGRDLRANELAIALDQSGALDGPDWREKSRALATGYGEALRLDDAEIAEQPLLIMERTLGTVGWRTGRWLAGHDSLEDVAERIEASRTAERWLARNAAELVDLLRRGLADTLDR